MRDNLLLNAGFAIVDTLTEFHLNSIVNINKYVFKLGLAWVVVSSIYVYDSFR